MRAAVERLAQYGMRGILFRTMVKFLYTEPFDKIVFTGGGEERDWRNLVKVSKPYPRMSANHTSVTLSYAPR
jgi:hypothetical protein